MQMLAFLLARFSEPSSYAGLGAILALAGLHFSDSDLGQIAQFLAAGCGVAALLLKERGVIQALLIALLLGGGLSACNGPSPSAATVTGDAQSACTVVSWGVPLVQALGAKLNPDDQAVLASAEQVVSACAAGDAPATISAVAAAVVAVLYPAAQS
jgi:hypothetical protein